MGIGIFLGIAALLAVFMGGDSGGAPPLKVNVYLGDGDQWYFAAIEGGKVIHTQGPYVDEETARAEGDAWLALRNFPVKTNVYLGDGGLWYFAGLKDSRVVHTAGPFANEVAARTAASSWLAQQVSRGAALAGCGPCARKREAALGLADLASTVLPYVLIDTPDGVRIDIRDLHAMYEWAKVRAQRLGIPSSMPAGKAVRRLVRSLTDSPIVGVRFGPLGDDEWGDVLAYLRGHLRPFTWGALVDLTHARLHRFGFTSIEEAGIQGVGRWPRGQSSGGFRSEPGKPVHALEPGSCAQYTGSGGRNYLCCRDDDGRISCRSITAPGDIWGPWRYRPSDPAVALGQHHGVAGDRLRTRGGERRGPGPGETAVDAFGRSYKRTSGERRL